MNPAARAPGWTSWAVPAPTTPSPLTIAVSSTAMHLVPACTPLKSIAVWMAVMRAPVAANVPPTYRWPGTVVSSSLCPVKVLVEAPAMVNESPAAAGDGWAVHRMFMSKKSPESSVMCAGGYPASAGSPGSRYSMRAMVSSSDVRE